MKRMAAFLALFTILLVNHRTAVPCAAAEKGYLLQYKFRANQRLDYQVKHNSSIRMIKGVSRGSALNESETRKHFTVVSVDRQGNAILEPVIDWVKMSVQFDGKEKKSYDSRTGEKPDRRFAGVARTVGRPLVQIKMAPNGKLIKAVPLLDRRTQRKVVKNNGPPSPTNDASKNFLIVFPEKPIRVGEGWTDSNLTVKLQVGGDLPLWQKYTILRRYELVSVKGDLATLKLTMAPKKPVNHPSLKVQLAQRLIAGTIVFDIKRGVIVSRKSTVDETVVGFAANQSRMHVKSQRTEQLLDGKK